MKKTLFGGLVALALALAPTVAAHADYPPGGGGLHGSLDKYTAEPGETVTYTAPATAYSAGESLTHTLTGLNGHTATRASLRTAPVAGTVGQFTATAEDDGSHTFAFVIPSQAGSSYTYQVLRADSSVWDTFDISVVNPVIPRAVGTAATETATPVTERTTAPAPARPVAAPAVTAASR
ncbi:hypothetical protein [Leifsonia sp. P73]|uniref:hypothetical protein n=1 Tax=Leifsonia sp. P73 TaxID=3423959 RepID=UPI003DA689DB